MTNPSAPPRRRQRLPRPVVIALAALGVVLALFAGWQVLKPKAPKDPYRLEEVTRGDVTRSVSASGTLQALVTVEVGSQLSGQVKQVLVDFNDRVRRGQLLAVLDPQTYVSRAQQGRAEVSSAVAARNEAQARADVARASYNRAKTLYDKGIVAKAALDTAEAEWKSAQAAVSSAAARIAQSQASLSSTQVDLGRTRIVSPIDGVVVDRQIEPGQTVAASLSAPVLFKIAQDLSRMEVRITVDEADIGQVAEGQAVRFTVDAYPDENFTGVVTQVRKQPESEQNVVAYIVIAEAANPDQKLLPGMTANADIVIEERRRVMRVPAAALRWTPPEAEAAEAPRAPRGFGGPPRGNGQRQGGGFSAERLAEQLDLDKSQREKVAAILAEARAKAQGGERGARREAMQGAYAKIEPLLKEDQKVKFAAMRARIAQAGGARASAGGMRPGVVWVLKDGEPSPVNVMVGATDGQTTEIRGPLKAGDQVVTGGGPRPKAQPINPFGSSGGGRRP